MNNFEPDSRSGPKYVDVEFMKNALTGVMKLAQTSGIWIHGKFQLNT